MLEWIPERLPPSGGLSAEGFYKLLGRPTLDPLTVLVREAAQNSWDARAHETAPIDFGIHLWPAQESLRQTLASRVFSHPERVVGTHLAALVTDPQLHVLVVSDRGTKGLGGPTRADEYAPETSQDWANFVLNAGKSKTGGNTGGTYGFGKTIAFVVSQANSMVVHTRTRHEGKIVTRLIACAIGDRFVLDGKNYTGRHWWGIKDDGAPTPIENEEADALAAELGMPSFGPSELGTNLMIISPDLGGRSSSQAMSFIAESILWHLWPKLVPGHAGQSAIQCSLSLDGDRFALPSFTSRPPLSKFVEAYKSLCHGDEHSLTFQKNVIQRVTPKKMVLGSLGTVPFAREQRAHVDDGYDPDDDDSPRPACPFPSAAHHIALLRSPELVIDYLEGPPAPDPSVEWVGVFRAADEYDSIFAAAEPPTHDAWNPDTVDDRQTKNILRRVLRDIQKVVSQRWGTIAEPAPKAVMSTASLADALGHLVLGKPGAGRGRPTRPPGVQSAQTARPSVSFVGSEVEILDGVHVSRAVFDITPAKGTNVTVLDVAIGVALDGQSSDPELDPLLRLESISSDNWHHAVQDATTLRHAIYGSTKQRIVLQAADSGSRSILWDVQADSKGTES